MKQLGNHQVVNELLHQHTGGNKDIVNLIQEFTATFSEPEWRVAVRLSLTCKISTGNSNVINNVILVTNKRSFIIAELLF